MRLFALACYFLLAGSARRCGEWRPQGRVNDGLAASIVICYQLMGCGNGRALSVIDYREQGPRQSEFVANAATALRCQSLLVLDVEMSSPNRLRRRLSFREIA